MKRIAFLLVAVATVAGIIAFTVHASGRADEAASPIASPIYGVTIPAGYRDWKLIAADQLLVPGKADQLRAQFGNDVAIRPLKKGRSRSQTAPSLPRFIGLVSRRKTTTKSWPVHSPALNLSSSGPPRMFSSWSRTQRSTPRRAAGGSLILRTESRATRRCTRPASPATFLRKIATMSLPITHPKSGKERTG
jgi:hypothetical protein